MAGLAVGLVVSLGMAPVGLVHAETPTPTPIAVTASPTATGSDAPDLAPDNSRQAWALGGAGVVALVAAAVIFLRRR